MMSNASADGAPISKPYLGKYSEDQSAKTEIQPIGINNLKGES